MPVISFRILNNINLETAAESISRYSALNGPWLNQFDNFYNNTRLHAPAVQRMNELLNIVRYDGWNMNRQGQCASIMGDIQTEEITIDQLNHFWGLVDTLPNRDLCSLACADNATLEQLTNSITEIRGILRNWHPSAGSVCFLTKVILMFNWGHTPAYDTRIRRILEVGNNISDVEFVQSLKEIGIWIRYFETRFGIDYNNFATNVMLQECGLELNLLPSGRSFDMMLFSLQN